LVPVLVAAFTAFLASATIAVTTGPKPPSKVCLNDSSNCGDDAKPKTGVKWHPGHYMLTYRGSPQSNLDTIRDEPYVIGAVRRYNWAQLETAAGVYDFSPIESDLRYLKSMPTPKRLVIQINDREYNKLPTPVGVLPNYLLEDPRYGGKTSWYTEHGSRWYGVAPTKMGWVGRMWDPVVMERWIALFRAIGSRFDKEPYLEAVSGQEVTTGFFDGSKPPDFSKEMIATQVKRFIDEVIPAFPRTNVVIYANHLTGQLPGIIEHCYEHRCAFGDVDTFPTGDYSPLSHGPTEGQRIVMGMEGGSGYAGKMPVMLMVSHPSLIKSGPNSPESIYKYAMERLGVTHLFWMRLMKTDAGTEQYSWQKGIVPLIEAKRGKTNSACPPNLPGCDTN